MPWCCQTKRSTLHFLVPRAFALAVPSTKNATLTLLPWPPCSSFKTQTPPPGSPPDPPVQHHDHAYLVLFLSVQGSASSMGLLRLSVTPLLPRYGHVNSDLLKIMELNSLNRKTSPGCQKVVSSRATQVPSPQLTAPPGHS